ncbi:MAG: class I SAM-dependent methyltransferase [Phaeodactylibacter sp.]|nr:class I SAM-dependent methyltransferase [Phaeodactylibacter sp.]
MKDNFSKQAEEYAQFRPGYPAGLYEALYAMLPRYQRAWDCGTGNGQVAVMLAGRFREVLATDLSARQIQHAPQRENISYLVQAAEHGVFPRRHFDLVTVGQAIHWFDFGRFYAVVRRVLRPAGVIAVFGYGLLKIEGPAGEAVRHFHQNIVGPYWDSERRYIDEAYRTIPFPFEETPFPCLEMAYRWDLEHLTGYLNTWSAVRHFEQKRGYNPVAFFRKDLEQAWGGKGEQVARFPLIGRLGRLE